MNSVKCKYCKRIAEYRKCKDCKNILPIELFYKTGISKKHIHGEGIIEIEYRRKKCIDCYSVYQKMKIDSKKEEDYIILNNNKYVEKKLLQMKIEKKYPGLLIDFDPY